MELLGIMYFRKNTIITLLSKRLTGEWTSLILLIFIANTVFPVTAIYSANFNSPGALSYSADTLKSDSLTADTVTKAPPQSKLESKVEYLATDSIRFDIEQQKMYLFGDAQVNYDEIILKSDYIEINLKEDLLYARGSKDSLDNTTGTPYFEDAGQGFSSQEMKYNFETKKGIIMEAKMQEGDGYIHGKTIKKTQEEILYIKGGKYTTCSLDDPHFHLEATKIKLVQDDKVITGPAYLAIQDIPTPLALPFGLFPNKKGSSSGIVIPAYGESPSLGYFFNNGGFYFNINDYVDLRLLGDIYTRGSWGGRAISRYKKRYKFGGDWNIQYTLISTGEQDIPGNYNETRNFFIKWKHRQDPKARPSSNFMADVNAGSASNFKNNLNSRSEDYLKNTFQSNIMYQKSFKQACPCLYIKWG